MEIIQKAAELLKDIKARRPLVHHITNYVTMNDSANAVLAIGGSPIMANSPEEVEEVVAMAKALVLNLGTPNSSSFRSMLLSGSKAKELNIPIVLDPVGAGVTAFRKEMCSKLLKEIKPSVIKGNISEIMYLANLDGCCYGVDSLPDIDVRSGIIEGFARNMECIVAATGRRDVVSDGNTTYIIDNGHEMLSKVTGTGCMTSSIIGAFCGVTEDYLAGTAAGIMAMGISGQLAFESLLPNDGIGTFKVRLFDSIYNLNEGIFERKGVISVEKRTDGLLFVSDN